jgi:hypothetical protein
LPSFEANMLLIRKLSHRLWIISSVSVPSLIFHNFLTNS